MLRSNHNSFLSYSKIFVKSQILITVIFLLLKIKITSNKSKPLSTGQNHLSLAKTTFNYSIPPFYSSILLFCSSIRHFAPQYHFLHLNTTLCSSIPPFAPQYHTFCSSIPLFYSSIPPSATQYHSLPLNTTFCNSIPPSAAQNHSSAA